jgi:hypothetical protein
MLQGIYQRMEAHDINNDGQTDVLLYSGRSGQQTFENVEILLQLGPDNFQSVLSTQATLPGSLKDIRNVVFTDIN